jgi:hypothetical protein
MKEVYVVIYRADTSSRDLYAFLDLFDALRFCDKRFSTQGLDDWTKHDSHGVIYVCKSKPNITIDLVRVE